MPIGHIAGHSGRVKVYLALRESSEGSSVLRVFSREKDARAYPLADTVEPVDVDEAPIDVRMYHELRWDLREDREPSVRSHWMEYSDRFAETTHVLSPPLSSDPGWLAVQGWDLDDVHRLYGERRGLYLAARRRAAAELVAALDRIDVRVVTDYQGRTELLTPLHPQGSRLRVDRARIVEQAGVDDWELSSRWFTVETLTFDQADGFSSCEQPNWYYPEHGIVPQVHPWRLGVNGLGFHQRETRGEVLRLGLAFLGVGQGCAVWRRADGRWDVETHLWPGRGETSSHTGQQVS
jgi:hypothetical protein